VQTGSKGTFVYVVRNGKAALQDVEVGEWYGENQIIKNGLITGDEVIVDGVNKVKTGSPVNVTGVWQPPPAQKPPADF
jgi:multidrug efflux pump subunit AcrA (membrane-fusion protein)